MKHRVLNINGQYDLVYENWLRLGECIVTPTLRHMNHYLSSFYDKKEEKKNYEKIDYIRALGSMTNVEYETLREACEDYDIRYENLVEVFKAEKTKKVKYKGLIFEKIK